MLDMQNLIPWATDCFLDMMPLYFVFSSATFDMMFSLATIIAYDLICRAFSIIIFFLCSTNRSSFAFCLFPLCEFAFALRVLVYFLLYFPVLPVPCWRTFSLLTQLSIMSRTLYLFKSMRRELVRVLWIFSYEYANLSSLILIHHNKWNIFV